MSPERRKEGKRGKELHSRQGHGGDGQGPVWRKDPHGERGTGLWGEERVFMGSERAVELRRLW